MNKLNHALAKRPPTLRPSPALRQPRRSAGQRPASQPSVSKVLRHAETQIGFALFKVVKGRLVPTEEAHLLFPEARDLYARVESLQETTKNLRRGGEGYLR